MVEVAVNAGGSRTLIEARVGPSAEFWEAFDSVPDRRPSALSGTMSAIYPCTYDGRPALAKVMSRTWSVHTANYVRWAYAADTLSSRLVEAAGRALTPQLRQLEEYGLRTVLPLEVWDVTDPTPGSHADDRGLCAIVEYQGDSTVRQHLFANRGDQLTFLETLESHTRLVGMAILRAREFGQVRDFVIQSGFDPKPRNFMLRSGWIYIDTFPVLAPDLIPTYRGLAPDKAFQKRFDTRYYFYDVLMRYYRICPEWLSDLTDTMCEVVEATLGIDGYVPFIRQAITAYHDKWGHFLPDAE